MGRAIIAIKYLLCTLCLLNIKIFITPEGECVEIRANNSVYPCTDFIKIDTGCWDENQETQLCGASWEQIEEG